MSAAIASRFHASQRDCASWARRESGGYRRSSVAMSRHACFLLSPGNASDEHQRRCRWTGRQRALSCSRIQVTVCLCVQEGFFFEFAA
eukprot:2450532-Pleurochrysis_carterae.AAC.1